MKLKAAISDSAPGPLIEAFGDSTFVAEFLKIVDRVFEVNYVGSRPAEYYVQKPDVTIGSGLIGIEVRLTGVSRGTRQPKVFHEALAALHHLVVVTTTRGLAGTGQHAQVFTVIMLDGDVPTPPDDLAFAYTSVLESEAVWVTQNGIE